MHRPTNCPLFIMSTITIKLETLYAGYAPEFNVSAYGTCEGEALNNLTDEIAHRQSGGEKSNLLLTR